MDELGLSRLLDADELAHMQANWNHWEANARQFGPDHTASWGDDNAMELEIANLLSHLSPGGRWLDVGCANGYTTFRTLARRPDEVLAMDYSPAMIEQARRAQPRFDPDSKITFARVNVLDIPEPDESFDQAYTIRMLINLPSWDAQQRAIREIHRVLKPGGRYVLSEAFAGSQERLNALRQVAGLPPLRMPEFNRYLREQELEAFLPGLFDVMKVERFSSPYYVATRFLRELVASDLPVGRRKVVEPDAPAEYNHPINKFAATLKPGSRSGDFGIQKAYVLRRV